MDVQNKTAIVTGGGSGIGRQVCQLLAERGADVVVADIDLPGAAETRHLIEKAGGEARAQGTDVTDPEAVKALFDMATSHFGGVDIVINNAGIVQPPPGWPEGNAKDVARVIEINLGGIFIVLRTALDYLQARGGGVVVNTASGAALFPFPPDPAYGAAKAGVVYLTRASAPLLESHGVRVVAALPGMTDTPMLNKSGHGKPADWLQPIIDAGGTQPVAEVAQTILDLVADDSLVGTCRACRPSAQGGDFDVPDAATPAS
ncbi:MAG: SDR family oxidoreductase [bacterium]|nr:SDR family oxidoreductase [bacterium]